LALYLKKRFCYPDGSPDANFREPFMPNITDNKKPYEPSLDTILEEEAFQKLMARDGASPESVQKLMKRTRGERKANGWSR
jgi:hypothetical protein